MSLPGTHPREMSTYNHTKTGRQVFTAAYSQQPKVETAPTPITLGRGKPNVVYPCHGISYHHKKE